MPSRRIDTSADRLFTLAYLALVLLVLPMDAGYGPPQWGVRAEMALPQVASGLVLLVGAIGFRAARRRHR
jgi:hypothetical protein